MNFLKTWFNMPDKGPPDSHENHVSNGDASSSTSVTKPMPNYAGRWFALICSLTTLIVAIFYSTAPVPLSDSYALCARDDHSIYTVDELNSQTQCLVVSDSFIVDTGTLGKSILSGRSL
jgi:hypothetical protein